MAVLGSHRADHSRGEAQGAETAPSEARASLLPKDTEEQSGWATGKDLSSHDTLTDGCQSLPTPGHSHHKCHRAGPDTLAQATLLFSLAQQNGLL